MLDTFFGSVDQTANRQDAAVLVSDRAKTTPARRFTIGLEIGQATTVIMTGVVAKLVYIDLILGPPQPMWPYLALTVPLAVALHFFFK